MKKKHLLSVLIFALIGLIIFLAYYFFFTTKGSSSIAEVALSKYLESEDIDIKKVEGNLARTLSYENIIFEDLKFLPEGSILKIQKLDISLTSLNFSGLTVKIHNGTLRMPNFDTILFYGLFEEGGLDINVYSKNVGVREVFDLFARSSDLKKISGLINDLDVYIKGTFLEPELTGTFKIDKLIQNEFSIINSPCSFNLRLKDLKDELKLFGSVSLNSGVISGSKTALINMQESKIIFNGVLKKPSLDLKGTSIVEGIKINVTLKGTFEKPGLKLASDPPRPQERLLIMLVTGKSWKGAEGSLSKGQLSVDLAKDFIDYFFFAGAGSKLAKRLGISDFSVTFEKDKKGVGIKKVVSGKMDVNYAVEQSQEKEGKAAVTQKVGGEYKITDSVSIGVEKELKQDNRTDQIQENQKTDDKVILKYKKEF
ncbi:MAG: translocation/assembly module TamB domain-containing protein [Candidatus Omnitrophota bacterium]